MYKKLKAIYRTLNLQTAPCPRYRFSQFFLVTLCRGGFCHYGVIYTISVLVRRFVARRGRDGRFGRAGANEERIGDDLWGACRCWRNNIIVNFAIAALLKYRGARVHRANARIMGAARVYLRSSSLGWNRIFSRVDIPIHTKGERGGGGGSEERLKK